MIDFLKKILSKFTLLLALFLHGCASYDYDDYQNEDEKNKNAFHLLINQYANNIEKIWGKDEVIIAQPKDYITYSDDLKTRVHINFTQGKITIETIDSNPKEVLTKAAAATFLMSDPSAIFKDKGDFVLHEPFLYKQVVDNTGEFIKWAWRANSFAKYLTDNKLDVKASDSKAIYFIEIKLTKNHMNERVQKYITFIKDAAQKYQFDERFILAFIDVESNFNPYAVSSSDAIGLMQVQQHTAGRDVFRRWELNGEPSKEYLLNPNNNIDIGTAYLALLRDVYLAGIKNPKTMQYAIISAYNGGASNVLKLFNEDRKKAVDVINSLTPSEVFTALISSHNLVESRRYLLKVNNILNSNRY